MPINGHGRRAVTHFRFQESGKESGKVGPTGWSATSIFSPNTCLGPISDGCSLMAVLSHLVLCRPFDDCCCRPAGASRQSHLHRLRENIALGRKQQKRMAWDRTVEGCCSNSTPTPCFVYDAANAGANSPISRPVSPPQHTNTNVVKDLLASGTFSAPGTTSTAVNFLSPSVTH